MMTEQVRKVEEPLTTAQRATLNAVLRFATERGYPPTFRDVADMMGWSSPNAASRMVGVLARKGFLAFDAGIARTIRGTEAAHEQATKQPRAV